MKRNSPLFTLHLSLLVSVAIALAGCNRNAIYSHYEHTDPDDWRRGETLQFIVTDIHSTDIYTPALGLRATSAYPYTYLSVVVAMQTANWQRTDTVFIAMTDEKGHTLGSGTMYRQYIMPLQPISLSDGDTLRIAIYHDMRCEMLQGIADVGITITDT